VKENVGEQSLKILVLELQMQSIAERCEKKNTLLSKEIMQQAGTENYIELKLCM
jgi:hypothetical protein